MMIVVALVTICFSLFSTAIMSYLAMATPIGPWIAPTLSLLALPIFSRVKNENYRKKALTFSVTGGSVGGIIAIAFGSSYPTLYFLDAPLFLSWMAKPWYFALLMTITGLAASLYGLVIANVLEDQLIEKQRLPFPIGQLVFNIIQTAHGSLRKTRELLGGLLGTFAFCALQGFGKFNGIIPKTLTLIRGRILKSFMMGNISASLRIPTIQFNFDMFPMLWAIGFLTGSTIAIPLAVGAISKIFLLDPLNECFFPSLCSWDFSIAFCSGLITISSLLGFLSLPKLIKNTLTRINASSSLHSFSLKHSPHSTPYLMLCGISLITFFTLFNFSILSACYLLVGTFLTTYAMTSIAGKIGLAQLGRFATFVMVPAMFIFGINPVHLTLIATFVEITGGVATDILFGRKVLHLEQKSSTKIIPWQLLGIIISCVCIGGIFWLLINHFGLGSAHLFAQRAQSRALLINIRSFNIYVLITGALYGLVLKKLNLNPLLVFGGLLMPINYSLGLIIGGFSTYLVRNTSSWEPFVSGVFAANSLWEVLKALV